MADSQQLACATCAPKGLCNGKGLATLKEGAWANNPLAIQVLGICSALAVTNRLENSLVMGAALIFVCVGSNLIVSLLRKCTPHRIRMIAEVAIIATFVIVFDQFLKAFYWDMSKQLGPYVGLIITNCIVMGRAEAFALQNPPMVSMVDGLANGLGYAAVLAIIGFFRELLGTGEILGRTIPVFSEWYTPNQLMILAPGAFFALGIVIGIFNLIKGPEPEENK
ncbi:MAG TPA: NADH:ubiquinone reductase (Na(+)-transporting) subunit D [Sedimentisphaerales bacterium]|nr:NADH:ubiquinone reductase (Na(+)-transporting) subunit D [Sedimentisphaerales bacterium]